MLTIRMGRIGFESMTDMLMKMLADAPSENDDNPAAPAIFAKLRQDLAYARIAAEQARGTGTLLMMRRVSFTKRWAR